MMKSWRWEVGPLGGLLYEYTSGGSIWAVVGAMAVGGILAIMVVVVQRQILWRRWGDDVYLVDYACAKYEEDAKTSAEVLIYFVKALVMGPDGAGAGAGDGGGVRTKYMTAGDVAFQTKVFLKSGIGEEAYVPRVTLEHGSGGVSALRGSHQQAHVLLVQGAVDRLLRRAALPPRLIDVLIVNSGVFNPSPSLASLLIRRFALRPDIKSYHLAGMGCSASLISVDLAARMFRASARRATGSLRYALIVSTEVLPELYDGRDRSMMVTNCLFRCAASALLLSCCRADRQLSKLQLSRHGIIRVNLAADDAAHNVVVVREDDDGVVGAKLHPDLIKVATSAIRINITRLAPHVLPLPELLKAGLHLIKARLYPSPATAAHYVPNFKLALDHFCIHPGSKAVILGVGKNLGLTDYDLEPSLMGLHRFGNTSCCGIWYELAYIEAKKRLKAGDKVWQIGLGSGFKCNSAVWKVLRSLDDEPLLEDNPWDDCIHRYPVQAELSDLPHVISSLRFVLT